MRAARAASAQLAADYRGRVRVRRRPEIQSAAVDGRADGCPAWPRRDLKWRRSIGGRPRCAPGRVAAKANPRAPHDRCAGDPRPIVPRSLAETSAAWPKSAPARQAWNRPQEGSSAYPKGQALHRSPGLGPCARRRTRLGRQTPGRLESFCQVKQRLRQARAQRGSSHQRPGDQAVGLSLAVELGAVLRRVEHQHLEAVHHGHQPRASRGWRRRES